MLYADNKCTYEERSNPHRYIFKGTCIVTGKQVVVSIPGNELFQYRQGKYIQDAMPSVSAEDREFLMSGISAEGWHLTFTDSEEEE